MNVWPDYRDCTVPRYHCTCIRYICSKIMKFRRNVRYKVPNPRVITKPWFAQSVTVIRIDETVVMLCTGRGAAMIIESLRLFYHIDCFKCCVCCVQLGDGLMGTDVRVRNNKLHCHNCYSSDDGKNNGQHKVLAMTLEIICTTSCT